VTDVTKPAIIPTGVGSAFRMKAAANSVFRMGTQKRTRILLKK